MRVKLVDPPAFTPPYDHALAAALARAGADVELITSRFGYGPVPASEGYRTSEIFYPLAGRVEPGRRGRTMLRVAEHVPGMMRLRRRLRDADVVHYQWFAVQRLDGHTLPPKRPRVLTAHDVLPRIPRPGQPEATKRLVRQMDGVIAHSEHSARRLREEVGADPGRIHVIPHGAFDYLTRLPEERPLPPELASVEKPVVLFFGLVRPYKGVDVLLEAFREIDGAELWVVGNPRMDLAPLRALAESVPATVRFVSRFVPDAEVPALFRRADVVVLPYRQIEQSGVLYTGLAFGKPMVLSAVGGFREVVDEHGAGRLVPPGEPAALAAALRELLDDPAERERLGAAAARAAAGPYSWDAVAARTLALYSELVR